ncbi:AAA family ATPase [Variovorax sp. J22R115]|uniref:AAA family ATPase n=1 Tax=Variovorax sp. J22R115 TaxID=3053509 RepID=UPI002575C3A4|nr:AAA family ATPase [Variovorax sp. J22R115]MDM0047530.1 AAA family ATPase [Variovorax sp. J22R115]
MQSAAGSIGERLVSAAARSFVGREGEIRQFESLLQAALPPQALLWLHGPGGIGKSTLLIQLRDHAAAFGRRTVWLDAALIEPQQAAFVTALGLDDPRGPAGDDPGVLFIDTAERLEPLLAWLRDAFLPALPGHWLVVCAGRQAPAADWRTDSRWAALMQVTRLEPLDESSARSLLTARGVDIALHDEALAFARGNPLALALLADLLVHPGAPASVVPAEGEVVQALVQRFTRDAATGRQRDALRVAAFARHTTLPMLSAVIGPDAASPLFEWLRGLSFMRAGPHGLVPHDLVREVLVADALWRDAAGSEALRRAINRHCYECIAASTGSDRLHQQAEVLYVQRHQPFKQPFFDWEALGQHRVEPARDADLLGIEALVACHEGDASLAWLRHWWQRQRDGFRLFWNAQGGCDGFLLMLRFTADTPALDRADPAVRAAWAFVDSERPLAGEDQLVLLRYWMHAQAYQAVSAAINLTAMHVVSHLITHPEAAWSVVYMADPIFWQPHFAGVNFSRCPAADFRAGEHCFGAFVHDWRFEPAERWTAGDYTPMPFARVPAARAPGALAEADFIDAVRQALRDLNDDAALQRGPLAAELGLTGVALHERLREAVQRLGAQPRDVRFRDALWRTYIEPAFKQEQAAAELGVPFATYRYRLQQGIERVAAMLRTP